MAAAASSGVRDEVFLGKLSSELLPGVNCLSASGGGIVVAESKKRALELLSSYPATEEVDKLLVFYRKKLPNGEFSTDLGCDIRVSNGSYLFAITLSSYIDEKRVTFDLALTDRSLQRMVFSDLAAFRDFCDAVRAPCDKGVRLGKKKAQRQEWLKSVFGEIAANLEQADARIIFAANREEAEHLMDAEVILYRSSLSEKGASDVLAVLFLNQNENKWVHLAIVGGYPYGVTTSGYQGLEFQLVVDAASLKALRESGFKVVSSGQWMSRGQPELWAEARAAACSKIFALIREEFAPAAPVPAASSAPEGAAAASAAAAAASSAALSVPERERAALASAVVLAPAPVSVQALGRRDASAYAPSAATSAPVPVPATAPAPGMDFGWRLQKILEGSGIPELEVFPPQARGGGFVLVENGSEAKALLCQSRAENGVAFYFSSLGKKEVVGVYFGLERRQDFLKLALCLCKCPSSDKNKFQFRRVTSVAEKEALDGRGLPVVGLAEWLSFGELDVKRVSEALVREICLYWHAGFGFPLKEWLKGVFCEIAVNTRQAGARIIFTENKEEASYFLGEVKENFILHRSELGEGVLEVFFPKNDKWQCIAVVGGYPAGVDTSGDGFEFRYVDEDILKGLLAQGFRVVGLAEWLFADKPLVQKAVYRKLVDLVSEGGASAASSAPAGGASAAAASSAAPSAATSSAPVPASALVPASAAVLRATPVPSGLSHSGSPDNVMFLSPLTWLREHGFTITDVKAAVREQRGVKYIFFEPKQAGGVYLDRFSFRNGYGFYCHSGKWPKMFGSIVLLPPDAVVAVAFERKNDPKRSMAIFYLRRGQISWEGILSNTEGEQMITVALPTLVEPLYPKEEPTYNPVEVVRRGYTALTLRYFLGRALVQRAEIPYSEEYATLGVSSLTENPNHVAFNLFFKKSGENLSSARFIVDLTELTLYRLLLKPGIEEEGDLSIRDGCYKIDVLDDLTIPKLLSFLSSYARVLGFKNIQIVGNSSPAMVLPGVDAYLEAVLKGRDIGQNELEGLEDLAVPAAAASAAAASVAVPTSLVSATTSVVEMKRYTDLVHRSWGDVDFATRVLQKAVERGAPAEILLDPAWSLRLNELFPVILDLSGRGEEPPMDVAISLKLSHARVTSTSVVAVLSHRKVKFVDDEAGLGRCVYLDDKKFRLSSGFSKITIMVDVGDRQFLLRADTGKLLGGKYLLAKLSSDGLGRSGESEFKFSKNLPFMDEYEPTMGGEITLHPSAMARMLAQVFGDQNTEAGRSQAQSGAGGFRSGAAFLRGESMQPPGQPSRLAAATAGPKGYRPSDGDMGRVIGGGAAAAASAPAPATALAWGGDFVLPANGRDGAAAAAASVPATAPAQGVNFGWELQEILKGSDGEFDEDRKLKFEVFPPQPKGGGFILAANKLEAKEILSKSRTKNGVAFYSSRLGKKNVLGVYFWQGGDVDVKMALCLCKCPSSDNKFQFKKVTSVAEQEGLLVVDLGEWPSSVVEALVHEVVSVYRHDGFSFPLKEWLKKVFSKISMNSERAAPDIIFAKNKEKALGFLGEVKEKFILHRSELGEGVLEVFFPKNGKWQCIAVVGGYPAGVGTYGDGFEFRGVNKDILKDLLAQGFRVVGLDDWLFADKPLVQKAVYRKLVYLISMGVVSATVSLRSRLEIVLAGRLASGLEGFTLLPKRSDGVGWASSVEDAQDLVAKSAARVSMAFYRSGLGASVVGVRIFAEGYKIDVEVVGFECGKGIEIKVVKDRDDLRALAARGKIVSLTELSFTGSDWPWRAVCNSFCEVIKNCILQLISKKNTLALKLCHVAVVREEEPGSAAFDLGHKLTGHFPQFALFPPQSPNELIGFCSYEHCDVSVRELGAQQAILFSKEGSGIVNVTIWIEGRGEKKIVFDLNDRRMNFVDLITAALDELKSVRGVPAAAAAASSAAAAASADSQVVSTFFSGSGRQSPSRQGKDHGPHGP